MQKPQVIHGLCYSLTSPNLPARKLAAEILVFFCHWEEEGEDRVGLSHVLQGLGHVETHHNSNHPIGQKVGKFDIWLRQMETTVEGRGRMGSTVGLSKDLKGTDDGTILDICVCLPFLNLAKDRLQ
jgi:cytokinesis protein